MATIALDSLTIVDRITLDMRLTLKVLSFCGKPLEESIESDFIDYPVLIGRSGSCDFVLEDANQYISSTHAIILIDSNQLMIQDASSNGVYINGSTTPMGQGNSVVLKSGDSLTMGNYVLTVSVTANQDPFESTKPIEFNKPTLTTETRVSALDVTRHDEYEQTSVITPVTVVGVPGNQWLLPNSNDALR